MEDKERELARDPVNTPGVKDGYRRSRELTIMLIGSVGKMRSFKISRNLILCTSTFLILYFVVSLVIFYLYFEMYADRKARSNQLRILETELRDKTRTLEQNKLYIKGLEEFYNSVKRGEAGKKEDVNAALKKIPGKNNPEGGASGGTETVEALQKGLEEKKDTSATLKKVTEPGEPDVIIPVESKKQETSVNEIDEKANADKTQEKDPGPVSPEMNILGKAKGRAEDLTETVEGYMEIRDIGFKKTDSGLTLDFKLANKLDDKKAAGYIHIIVMNKDKEFPPEWNSAYNKISGGFPVDYKHGQQFLIQNFRPYQRQYSKDSDSELPSFIRILVYDSSGQKILEREFSVE